MKENGYVSKLNADFGPFSWLSRPGKALSSTDFRLAAIVERKR